MIPIRRFDGKKIGELDLETGTAVIPKTEKHVMRIFQAFGLSKSVIDFLKHSGTSRICFDYEGRKKYIASLEQFEKSDIERTEKEDEQKFVKIKDMIEVGK